MILAGSPLSLARVPLTEVYLKSNRQPEKLDAYFAYFHDTLLAGDDLAPVLLLRDEARRMYRLEDGRKRFAASVLAGRSDLLAVVIGGEGGGVAPCTAGVAGQAGSWSASSPGSPS